MENERVYLLKPVETGYRWRESARLRSYRNALGLSSESMATRLAEITGRTMAPRSYQSMESGRAAIPESLWETIDKLLDKFSREVALKVHEANREIQLAGMADEDYSILRVIFPVDQDTETDWDRRIMSSAMMIEPSIDPKYIDSTPGEQEKDE